MDSSSLSELIHAHTTVHKMQHQALVTKNTEQEQRFQVLIQVQQEDQWMYRGLIESAGTPATVAHNNLTKMGSQDDPEYFIMLFE